MIEENTPINRRGDDERINRIEKSVSYLGKRAKEDETVVNQLRLYYSEMDKRVDAFDKKLGTHSLEAKKSIQGVKEELISVRECSRENTEQLKTMNQKLVPLDDIATGVRGIVLLIKAAKVIVPLVAGCMAIYLTLRGH
jgi:septation ring formation regulator EzrA